MAQQKQFIGPVNDAGSVIQDLKYRIAKLNYFCRKFPAWKNEISYLIDSRGRPQSRPVVITIFTQSVRPSVRPSQNFKIKRQSLPAGTVGWPSGSLMTPVPDISKVHMQRNNLHIHIMHTFAISIQACKNQAKLKLSMKVLANVINISLRTYLSYVWRSFVRIILFALF